MSVFKQTKRSQKPPAHEIFSQHQRSASAPSPSTSQSRSYHVFIAELISTFNALSTTSATPTSSSIIHTFFQGGDHEARVDSQQKRKVIKALQHADPAKVNEVIAILKAMPDPSAKKPDTVNPAESSNNTKAKVPPPTAQKQKQEQLEKDLTEWDRIEKNTWKSQKSNDQTTGVAVDPTSCKSPISSSWWFLSTDAPTSADAPATKETNAHTPTSLSRFRSLRLSTKSKLPLDSQKKSQPHDTEHKKTLSTGEQIAQAAASLLAIAAASKPKEIKAEPVLISKTSSLHRQSSMPIIRSASLKALLPTFKSMPPDSSASTTVVIPASSQSTSSSLVDTINSITRQLLPSQQNSPSIHCISIYTFWWGYEIFVPHKSMKTIEAVSNTSLIFFNILSSAIHGVPGLAALVPIAQIIASWFGYQWSVINAEDKGKGVIISAIWILPVAPACRSWDHYGIDHSNTFQALTLQRKKTAKSRLQISGT
ncbi:hypothetical protein BGZ65_007249 [Modicella reniformis]|uniref:Uncharacterized protein n=1 Tax=Modicella reniformis TaxID=1440133 RepID=A0A9P6IJH6_9FUNG|nr:hypothetical protein BGZ65_007249 [Modicella reniformis]